MLFLYILIAILTIGNQQVNMASANPQEEETEHSDNGPINVTPIILELLTWDYQAINNPLFRISEECNTIINNIHLFDSDFIPGAANSSNAVSKSLKPMISYFQNFSNFKLHCLLSLDRPLNAIPSSTIPYRPVLASIILNKGFLRKHIVTEINFRRELSFILETEQIPVKMSEEHSQIYEGIHRIINYYSLMTLNHLTKTSKHTDYNSYVFSNKKTIDVFLEDFIIYYNFITLKTVFDIIPFIFYEENNETKIREFIKKFIKEEKQEKLKIDIKGKLKEFNSLIAKENHYDVLDEKKIRSEKTTSSLYMTIQECGQILANLVNILNDVFD